MPSSARSDKPSVAPVDNEDAAGQEIMLAMKTSIINSETSIVIMPVTEAPRTFRIPISFVLCSTVKEAKPNNPRQATKMAINANTVIILLNRVSEW